MKTHNFLVRAVVLLHLLSPGSPYAREEKAANPAPFQTEPTKSSRADDLKRKLEVLLSPVGVSTVNFVSAAEIDSYQELQIRWQAYAGVDDLIDADGPKPSVGNQFSVNRRKRGKGRLPQPRSLDLSTEQMLVIAVDAKGELKAWTLINDPRLIRAEALEPIGEIRGKRLHRSKPEFIVELPAVPEITEVRFYHPAWTGTEFRLELLGSSPF